MGVVDLVVMRLHVRVEVGGPVERLGAERAGEGTQGRVGEAVASQVAWLTK